MSDLLRLQAQADHQHMLKVLHDHYGGCALETIFFRAALDYLGIDRKSARFDDDIRRGVEAYVTGYRECPHIFPHYLQVVYNKVANSTGSLR